MCSLHISVIYLCAEMKPSTLGSIYSLLKVQYYVLTKQKVLRITLMVPNYTK